MKPDDFVNAGALRGADLEKALAAVLRRVLTDVPWLQDIKVDRAGRARDLGYDLLAKVPLTAGGHAALCVECKSEFRPSMFATLANRRMAPPGRPRLVVPVLALPIVSSRIAELCVAHGWSWYDLAGNCRLDVPEAIFVERTGNQPVHPRPRPAANLSTPEAARIVRALLAPDNAKVLWGGKEEASQRWLRAHFAELPELEPGQPSVPTPSLGLVNKVIRHLRDQAFIEELAGGRFRLRDPLGLLTAWRNAYRFGRHRQRNYFTLLQGRQLREALAKLGRISPGHAAYASFSAAELQAPHVRQPRTWLFVDERYEEAFREVVEAKVVDSGSTITVLVPDDEGVFYLQDRGGADRLACTNPVQTYVDLCHAGGRGAEAAEALLEQTLKPAWKRRGLL